VEVAAILAERLTETEPTTPCVALTKNFCSDLVTAAKVSLNDVTSNQIILTMVTATCLIHFTPV